MSRSLNNTLKKAISLRVFWNIRVWSSEGQRKKFGAQTIDMLSKPIFVASVLSGVMNCCVCVYGCVCVCGCTMIELTDHHCIFKITRFNHCHSQLHTITLISGGIYALYPNATH